MKTVEVSGAYGRTYATADAMRADWQAGRDFVVHDFRGDCYGSVRDFPWCAVTGRYGRRGDRVCTLQTPGVPVAECDTCGDWHAAGQGHTVWQ